MQENEFEKQVKDKMEELGFVPSAPVWETIKKQIEKKKRRVLPFIFLLSVLIITGGYFFYADVMNDAKKSGNNFSSVSNKNKSALSSSKIKKENQLIQVDTSILNSKNHQQSALFKQNKNQNNQSDIQVFALQNFQANRLKNFDTGEKVKISNYRKNAAESAAQTVFKKDDATALTNTSDFNKQPVSIDTSKQTNVDYILNKSSIQNSYDSNTLKPSADSSVKINAAIAKNDSLKSTKESIVKKNNNKPAKWQYGFTAMYGKSNLNDHLFNAALSTTKALSSLDFFQVNNAQTKHPYKTDDAYKLGITVRRNVFNRSYLSTGLQYVHLTTISTTAGNVNAVLSPGAFNSFDLNSAGAFNRYSTEKTYFNKYNFIEVPVLFQSNFFTVKQFSLSYNAGISVMQLLSAKSLLYNSKSNIFFADNKLLRRTQFQILSGINLQLNTKNKGSFLLGPQLEYSLSTFLKNRNNNHLHYINYGLQASWLFGKK